MEQNLKISPKLSRNKWGQLVAKFSDQDSIVLDQHRQAIRQTIEIFDSEGYATAIGYGTLLGAVREGSFIPHDDDVDLILLAKSKNIDSVREEMKSLAQKMLRSGYKINLRSYGKWEIRFNFENKKIKIDLFVGWEQNDYFYLDFAIMGSLPASAVLPFGIINFEGLIVCLPKEPELMLQHLYGVGWRLPDPNFKYRISDEQRAFFSRLAIQNK